MRAGLAEGGTRPLDAHAHAAIESFAHPFKAITVPLIVLAVFAVMWWAGRDALLVGQLVVTLAFLGWRSRSELDGVVAALRSAAAAAVPFVLEPVRYRETHSVAMLVLDAVLTGAKGLSLWASHATTRAQQVEAELAQLQRSVAEPQASNVTRELEELQRKEAVQTQLRQVLQGNMSATSLGYSDLLISLGRQTQPGLWITGLKVRGDGRDLELSGRMTNPALLPAYLRRLEREDRFKSRRFAQIEMRDTVAEEGAAPSGITEFTLRGRDAAERMATQKETP